MDDATERLFEHLNDELDALGHALDVIPVAERPAAHARVRQLTGHAHELLQLRRERRLATSRARPTTGADRT